MLIQLQQAPFDPGQSMTNFCRASPDMGAVVSFTGLVRGDDGLEKLLIEHYPAMTQSVLADIAATASARWSLGDVMIIHRYGEMVPGEPIMMVATMAPHRRAAFEAADYLMDYLKSRAPFWKKELRAGRQSWVEAASQDEQDLSRWS